MIAEDTRFWFDLCEQLKGRPEAAIVILGLLPYLSLYVVEVFRYLSDRVPSAADALKRNRDAIIRASRNRIKLLDNRRTSIDDFVEYHAAIVEVHRDWFTKDHTGFLGWLKRALQPDLGIFTYGDSIINTTHVAQLNLGQDARDKYGPSSAEISSVAKSVGYDIGEFVATMVNVFPSPQQPPSEAYCALDPNQLQHQDVNSTRFYRRTFKGICSSTINATLVLFLSTANFVKEILGKLVTDRPITYFKIKVITLFHLGSSLNSLQDYCYSKDLHSQTSREFFADILSDSTFRQFRKQRQLRNLLVHYRIEEIPESALDEEKPLCGVIEYFFDGMNLQAADELADRQLNRLAGILNQWYG